ncbi:MAG TPA: metallophosphoesterase [Pyrinomonadaceae bacterium]|jgi:3',5'-cyclic AMP phosphodiesterase CpdA
MKTFSLMAIVCAVLLSCSAAYAQSGTGFPTLSPVPRTGQLKDDPTKTHFTFIAAGDNRPSGDTPIQPATLAYIMKHSKRHKPDFMIWSGDIIAGFRKAGKPMHKKTLKAQYKEFFRVAHTAGVPIFNSPGNHEMDLVTKSKDGNTDETSETPDEQMQALYLEEMKYPSNAPAYGAFNYGNSRFIAVNTEEVPPITAVRSEGKVVANKLKLDPGFVSLQQIELLTADLEANKDKAHIFVFMHHPIKPAKKGSRLNKENADELEALFAKYPNVSYVIAAHEHIYFNASSDTLTPASKTSGSSDGPVYLVSGGAGAPLDSCPSGSSKNCSASHHYLVFEVDGDKVDVKVVIVPSKLSKTK